VHNITRSSSVPWQHANARPALTSQPLHRYRYFHCLETTCSIDWETRFILMLTFTATTQLTVLAAYTAAAATTVLYRPIMQRTGYRVTLNSQVVVWRRATRLGDLSGHDIHEDEGLRIDWRCRVRRQHLPSFSVTLPWWQISFARVVWWLISWCHNGHVMFWSRIVKARYIYIYIYLYIYIYMLCNLLLSYIQRIIVLKFYFSYLVVTL